MLNLLPGCLYPEPSPDGKWAVGTSCPNEETLIASLDGKKVWRINNLEYVDGINGEFWIRPFFSTPNGRSLFLALTYPGLTPYFQYNDGHGLLRLDLETGRIDEILGHSLDRLYSLSVSPDGRQVAYVEQSDGPLILTILDLITSEENRYDLSPHVNRAGNMLWSPDHNRIVLEEAWMEGPFESTKSKQELSLAIIDLQTGQLHVMMQGMKTQLTPIVWTSKNLLELTDPNGLCRVYDLTAGSFTRKECKGEK